VELTIPAALTWAARKFGDAEALADPGPGGSRLSYRELGGRVTAVAAALIDRGVVRGDRVAVWAPNSCQWVLAALGRSARVRSWFRSAPGSPGRRRWT